MFQFLRRSSAAFAAGCVVVAMSTVCAAPAGADTTPTGVGSALGSGALATLDVGTLLHLGLLEEASGNTIDPSIGTSNASESFTPVRLNQTGVPQTFVTNTSGAEDQKSVSLVDLSSLAPFVTGTINAGTLSSIVDADGARSILSSTLANVDALGGVAALDSGGLDLSTAAGPTASVVNRGVSLNALTVLDLRGLLNMFGIDLTDLSVDQLANLADGLGLLGTISSATGLDLTNAASLTDAVNTLETAILSNTLAPLCDPGGLLHGLPICAVPPDVSAVTDQLTSLLNGVLSTLSGTALLRVEGVNAKAIATAADTLDHSSAVVTAGISKVLVGDADLGGFDLSSTLAQIQALAANATSQINAILGAISPALANIVTVAFDEQTTNLDTSNGYVNALAAVNALHVTIKVPDVCALLNGIAQNPSLPAPVDALPTSTVGDALAQLGSTVDCSSIVEIPQFRAPTTNGLAPTALPIDLSAVDALTKPVELKVASVSSAGNFRTPTTPSTPASPTSTETPLAVTGANDALFLVVGAVLAAAALVTRRTLRRAALER